jgi:hypothetical protein
MSVTAESIEPVFFASRHVEHPRENPAPVLIAERGEETEVPVGLNSLGSCFKGGFDMVKKLALRHSHNGHVTRRSVHREFETMKPYLAAAASESASSTIRYRALPDSSRAKASLIRLIGKCSVCGATLCRAAKLSILSMEVGEPAGEPEMHRCCRMSEKTATGMGSRTAPTRCSRPFGAIVPIIASQSSLTFTVLISRSKLPASFLIAAVSLLDTT